MYRPTRFDRDTIDNNPYPTDDPVDRLRHVVAVFADSPAEQMVVMATSGIYPADATLDGTDRGRTGLTHGDLRAILDRLGG